MPYTTPIDAGSLMPGDVFPSHDELRHEVETVAQYGESVVVHVRKSDGESYTTTFPLDHEVSLRYA